MVCAPSLSSLSPCARKCRCEGRTACAQDPCAGYPPTPRRMPTPSRRKLWVGARLVLVLALLAAAGSAAGQDLPGRLSHKQQTLHQKRDLAGVLSSTIKRDSVRIDVLTGQVATLRNRVAIVSTELRRKQLALQGDVRRLKSLRGRLDRSLGTLSARLIAIYKSDQPDVLTLILNSSGFDDLPDALRLPPPHRGERHCGGDARARSPQPDALHGRSGHRRARPDRISKGGAGADPGRARGPAGSAGLRTGGKATEPRDRA